MEFLAETIDPTPFLTFGTPGLVAFLAVILVGAVVTVISGIFVAERFRTKTSAQSEKDRDQAFISAMNRSSDAVERVTTELGKTNGRVDVLEAKVFGRFGDKNNA